MHRRGRPRKQRACGTQNATSESPPEGEGELSHPWMTGGVKVQVLRNFAQ